MSYVNFTQYNLPFTQEQDERMQDLGLIHWAGRTRTGPNGSFEVDNFAFPPEHYTPDDNPIVIYHLGFWTNEDCEVQIKGFEYHNEEWVVNTQTLRIGAGNKLELEKVRIFSVGITINSEGQNEEYWGNNAKLDMSLADFDTLDKIESGEITNLSPAYWS